MFKLTIVIRLEMLFCNIFFALKWILLALSFAR